MVVDSWFIVFEYPMVGLQSAQFCGCIGIFIGRHSIAIRHSFSAGSGTQLLLMSFSEAFVNYTFLIYLNCSTLSHFRARTLKVPTHHTAEIVHRTAETTPHTLHGSPI